MADGANYGGRAWRNYVPKEYSAATWGVSPSSGLLVPAQAQKLDTMLDLPQTASGSQEGGQLNLYPGPAGGQRLWSIDNFNGTLRIFNDLGNVVVQTSGSGSNYVFTDNLGYRYQRLGRETFVRAALNANQIVTHDVWTKLNYIVENLDRNGDYNNSVPYFLVPEDGVYLVIMNALVQNAPANLRAILSLFWDSSLTSESIRIADYYPGQPSATADSGVNGSALLTLSTGNTLYPAVMFQNTTTNPTVYSSNVLSYLMIARVS